MASGAADLSPVGGLQPPPPEPTDRKGVELIGRWYAVKAGDTINGIAGRHGVPPADLIEINGLKHPERIEVDQRLFLYGVEEIIRRAQRPGKPGAAPPGRRAPTAAGVTLTWPVRTGQVSSRFGPRWGRAHRGLDIAGSVGTPILAAAAGRVIYSDNQQRGYGNLVIVEHSDQVVTVYAHNDRNVVDEGQVVRQGAKIAELGSTGNSTGPHLHFEVRIARVARDPLQFLPKR